MGVSTELLRAWERRYGLLSPTRTAGGFRLYADADEQRVRRMLLHLEAGVSAAEGARLALLEPADPAPGDAPANTAPGALSRAAALGARSLRRRGCACGLRQPARHLRGRDRAARCRAALSPRARRALGARRGVDRPGALRQLAAARPAARPRARLGQRGVAARAARLRAGRPARPRADLLRARPAPPRLAHRVPGAGHTAGHARRDGAPARAGARRPDGDHARLRRGGPSGTGRCGRARLRSRSRAPA